MSKGKSKGNSKGNSKGKSKGSNKDKSQDKGKGKSKSKGKGNERPDNDKECYVCAKRGHLARDSCSRANNNKIVNEVEAENANAEPGKEFVFTIKNVISDVRERIGDD